MSKTFNNSGSRGWFDPRLYANGGVNTSPTGQTPSANITSDKLVINSSPTPKVAQSNQTPIANSANNALNPIVKNLTDTNKLMNNWRGTQPSSPQQGPQLPSTPPTSIPYDNSYTPTVFNPQSYEVNSGEIGSSFTPPTITQNRTEDPNSYVATLDVNQGGKNDVLESRKKILESITSSSLNKEKSYQDATDTPELQQKKKNILEQQKRIARLKNAYDHQYTQVALDSHNGTQNLASVRGEQALIRSQEASDIAMEQAFLSAMQSDYQTAIDHAEKGLKFKFQDEEDRVDRKLTELTENTRQLTDEQKQQVEQKKMQLLDYKKKLEDAKSFEANKLKLALKMADLGASVGEINAVYRAGTMEEAISNYSPFVSQIAQQDRAMSQMKDFASMSEKGSSGSGKPLNQTTIQQFAASLSSIKLAEKFIDKVEAKKELFGPLKGRFNRNLVYPDERKMVDADIIKLVQVIGKKLEGGVLRKDDVEKYKQMLPNIKYRPNVAIHNLREMIDFVKQELADQKMIFEAQGYNVDFLNDSVTHSNSSALPSIDENGKEELKKIMSGGENSRRSSIDPIWGGDFYSTPNIVEKTLSKYGVENQTQHIKKVADAIAGVESRGSGNYKAMGVYNQSQGYPLGRYQIMEKNLPSWSKEALGRVVSPQEFLNNPKLQDAVFAHRYLRAKKQGYSDADFASIWFTGGPLHTAKNKKDALGTTAPVYVRKFLNNLN